MPGPSSSSRGPAELTIDQQAFVDLSRALRREEDGKELRKQLIRELKQELAPAVSEVKASVQALPSGDGPRAGRPLRQAIAQQVRSEVKLSGRSPGAKIRVKKRNMPRGFKNAPHRLNSPQGWRHPVFGRDVWVDQRAGRPNWFDGPMKERQPEFRRAVLAAVERYSEQLAQRLRSRR